MKNAVNNNFVMALSLSDNYANIMQKVTDKEVFHLDLNKNIYTTLLSLDIRSNTESRKMLLFDIGKLRPLRYSFFCPHYFIQQLGGDLLGSV